VIGTDVGPTSAKPSPATLEAMMTDYRLMLDVIALWLTAENFKANFLWCIPSSIDVILPSVGVRPEISLRLRFHAITL